MITILNCCSRYRPRQNYQPMLSVTKVLSRGGLQRDTKEWPGKDMSWDNRSSQGDPFQLFPALNPSHLFPFKDDPTDKNSHGYIDQEGFVKDQNNQYTGWRAVNFFPYAIFTPLTGSVSGIYIRLPKSYMSIEGKVDISTY